MTKPTNQCAPSEDSGQPGHPPSLIRVFAVRMEKLGFDLVRFLFYGPATHFRSFRAQSVNLATLFLGKPPRQFTST